MLKTIGVAVLLSLWTATACSRPPEEPAPLESRDPARCSLVNLGDAEDWTDKQFPDDQMITVGGISNPIILVWRDSRSGQVFYVTRVAGTGARLLYMARLSPGETPVARSSFSGTIQRWKQLPPDLTRSMSAAIRAQWDVQLNPDDTWVISAGQKPEGCP
jgi:hypothetical protein